jgi:hypothetical protein
MVSTVQYSTVLYRTVFTAILAGFASDSLRLFFGDGIS